MTYRTILCLLSALSTLHSQTPSPRPEFEVASVKPFVPGPPSSAGRGSGSGCTPVKLDQGRADFCATLPALIAFAYRIPAHQVTGPDWMSGRDARRFAIAAKLPQGASERQAPEMLQALLVARFQLAVHRGTREEAVTALVVAKGGLKVKETTASEPNVPASGDDTIRQVGAASGCRWQRLHHHLK